MYTRTGAARTQQWQSMRQRSSDGPTSRAMHQQAHKDGKPSAVRQKEKLAAAAALKQGKSGKLLRRLAIKTASPDCSEPEPEEQRRQRRLAKRLCTAARTGDTPALETLLDAGAPIDAAGWGGNNALMVAAWSDRADCVAALVERGANIDVREEDFGFTPLILAAQ